MINWVKMIRCTLDKIELDFNFRDYDFINLVKLQKKKKKTHINIHRQQKAKTGNAMQKLIKIDNNHLEGSTVVRAWD